MSPRDDSSDPLRELAGFTVDPDPELPGRVQRSIQRREFVADALDFSLAGLFSTLWQYVRAVFESLQHRPDDPHDPEAP